MDKECIINDLSSDIERLRDLSQGGSDWFQLTYADQISDPSISETDWTVEEWELDRKGDWSYGNPE